MADYTTAEANGSLDIINTYAVYRYQFCTRTRSPTIEESESLFQSADEEVAEGKKKQGEKELIEEEVIKLSLLSSNLQAEKETSLRSLLTVKVQCGTLTEGTGNILHQTKGQLFDEQCMIYFNLLKCGKAEGESERPESQAKMFLVCFMVVADAGLDLFHADLDSYCKSLVPYLDKYMESVDVSDYLNLIESWYDINVCFVSRCMKVLKNLLAPLLYHTLQGDKISLESIPDTERRDIERFVACCSLSQLVEDKSDKIQEGDTTAAKELMENTFSIMSDGMMYTANSEKTTAFCNDCVLALEKVKGDNPFKLRQILENYKLKVIQDMNTLKRLTKQAETDYYALYRAYVFLVNCDNGEILLHNAKIQNDIEENMVTRNVLLVLEDYIKAKDGFKPTKVSENEKSRMQYMIKIIGH